MATLPAGPIRLLSKAHFRKNETPNSTAAIPIRFNQYCPMRFSRLVPFAVLTGGPEDRAANDGGCGCVGVGRVSIDGAATGVAPGAGVVGCGGDGATTPSRCSSM